MATVKSSAVLKKKAAPAAAPKKKAAAAPKKAAAAPKKAAAAPKKKAAAPSAAAAAAPKKKAAAPSAAAAAAPKKKAVPSASKAKPCFGPEARALIGELARRQDREWFAPRKEMFRELLTDPLQAVMSSLGPLLLDQFPAVEDAAPKLFRIYRDTRFSKDKRPFKEHVGGELSLGRAGFYLHVSATEVFAAVGLWQMEPDVLQRYRRSIVDNDELGNALLRATEALEARGWVLMSMGELARAPAGISPSHPRIQLLKHKGWAMSLPLAGVDVGAPSLPGQLASLVLQAGKALGLLERAVAGR